MVLSSVFRQNGPQANSGALFLAYVTVTGVPEVECSRYNAGSLRRKTCLRVTPFRPTAIIWAGTHLKGLHRIIANLKARRDALVQGALGTKNFGGVTYSTTAETLTGVMVSGTTGVNHGEMHVSSCTFW